MASHLHLLRCAVSVVVGLLAVGAVGGTTGYFIGISGPESTILEAVLPTLLAGVGTGTMVFVVKGTLSDKAEFCTSVIVGSVVIITFITALILMTEYGLKVRNNSIATALKEKICSEEGAAINLERFKIGLPFLTNDQVCPRGFPFIPIERIKECTLIELRVNRKMKSENSSNHPHIPIEEVCPDLKARIIESSP